MSNLGQLTNVSFPLATRNNSSFAIDGITESAGGLLVYGGGVMIHGSTAGRAMVNAAASPAGAASEAPSAGSVVTASGESGLHGGCYHQNVGNCELGGASPEGGSGGLGSNIPCLLRPPPAALLRRNFFVHPCLPQKQVLRQAAAVVASANTTVFLRRAGSWSAQSSHPGGGRRRAARCRSLGKQAWIRQNPRAGEGLSEYPPIRAGSPSGRRQLLRPRPSMLLGLEASQQLRKSGGPSRNSRRNATAGRAALSFYADRVSHFLARLQHDRRLK